MAKQKKEQVKQEKFYVSFHQETGLFGIFERKNHPVTGAGLPACLASDKHLYKLLEDAEDVCETLNS